MSCFCDDFDVCRGHGKPPEALPAPAKTTYDADTRTRGQRWADAVTRFGGSWAFICTFVGSSAVWVLWNSLAAGRPDPYPFLFLNMLLTVISTFQQPFVLLSQNRQNEEDRQRDEEDRAQLRLLHKRLDDIDAKLKGASQ
jgi:uncharacterized membrane protein